MIIQNPNIKERIYLYAMWGLFFLACFYGQRNKEKYNFIHDEQDKVWNYLRKKGYNIHWNVRTLTYEILKL